MGSSSCGLPSGAFWDVYWNQEGGTGDVEYPLDALHPCVTFHTTEELHKVLNTDTVGSGSSKELAYTWSCTWSSYKKDSGVTTPVTCVTASVVLKGNGTSP